MFCLTESRELREVVEVTELVLPLEAEDKNLTFITQIIILISLHMEVLVKVLAIHSRVSQIYIFF